MVSENAHESEKTSGLFNGFRSIKRLVNTLLERVLQGANAFIGEHEGLDTSIASTMLVSTSRFIGSLVLLLLQFPKVDGYEIQGSVGRVIYLGTQHGADAFQKS